MKCNVKAKEGRNCGNFADSSGANLLLTLVLILNCETSGDAVHLVPGLDLSDLYDLSRRSGLGIDVSAGTSESSQGALRSGVLDSLLPHHPAHQPYRFVVYDDRVVRYEGPD